MRKFNGTDALLDYLLSGNSISVVEATLMFGVQSPNRALTSIKRRGYFIGSQRAPLTKIIKRMNQYMVCEPPKDLPHKEILVSEYWIKR
jgi:hypothetical protein